MFFYKPGVTPTEEEVRGVGSTAASAVSGMSAQSAASPYRAGTAPKIAAQ